MTFSPPPSGAPAGFNDFVPFPDGAGGNYLEGTFELTIVEATGIYAAFKAGHNHMVDRLHQLAEGSPSPFPIHRAICGLSVTELFERSSQHSADQHLDSTPFLAHDMERVAKDQPLQAAA